MIPIKLTCLYIRSFRTIAGVIRCAHKYQADDMAHHARRRLLRAFQLPVRVHIHSPQDSPTSWASLWGSWKERGDTFPDFEIHDAIELVSLLRLIDEDADSPARPLSWALYLSTLCGPTVLKEGVQRRSGAIAQLSNEDYALCMKASIQMARDCHRSVQLVFRRFLLDEDATRGSSRKRAVSGKCREAVRKMAEAHAMENVAYTLFDLFLLIEHRSRVSKAYQVYSKELCNRCCSRLSRYSAEVAAETLINLPTYFSISIYSPTKTNSSTFRQ